MPTTMRAMILERIVPIDGTAEPLRRVEVPIPEPQAGEILIKVGACGVCHTELDEIEGRTAPPRLPVIPGHEVVGRVERLGSGVTRHALGDRVGVGWIHSSCGGGGENLSPEFVATGRDADGGYAEYMTVPEAYAFAIPEVFSDVEAAPLMCAGAIGYRALRLTGIGDGARLGLTGFGGSAHLVAQLARHLYPRTSIYAFARSAATRRFARGLGAAWAGEIGERSPEKLDAIIDTTPAWKPVVEALADLRPGGRLVINAIRKQDGDKHHLQRLSYHRHLWMEKEIKSVANISGRDIAEFLPIAGRIPLRPTSTSYRLEEANRALRELKAGAVRGAKVLTLETGPAPRINGLNAGSTV